MNSNKRNVGESRIRGLLGEVKNEFSNGVDSSDEHSVGVLNNETELVETKIKKVEEEVERKRKK